MISQCVRSIDLLRDNVESFDQYPFRPAVVEAFANSELPAKVTSFVGENGWRKSMLEAIAIAMGCNAEGGSTSFRFGSRRGHPRFPGQSGADAAPTPGARMGIAVIQSGAVA